MNFTQGRLSQKDVKEWVRVHETNLDMRSTTTASTTTRSTRPTTWKTRTSAARLIKAKRTARRKASRSFGMPMQSLDEEGDGVHDEADTGTFDEEDDDGQGARQEEDVRGGQRGKEAQEPGARLRLRGSTQLWERSWPLQFQGRLRGLLQVSIENGARGAPIAIKSGIGTRSALAPTVSLERATRSMAPIFWRPALMKPTSSASMIFSASRRP